MEVTVLNNQSLFDIALQVYGSAEAAFTLAFENGMSLTAHPPEGGTEGGVLQFSPANVINRQVVDFYRINNIRPATAIENEPDSEFRFFENYFEEYFE